MLFLLKKMRGAAFLLFCCLPLAAQQASVEGVASDTLTHAPLAGVHVRLSILRPGGPSMAYGAMSDPTGHFSIAAIEPGTYDLKAEHIGYLYLGAQSASVKSGRNDFKIEMTLPAIISGRILDENGDPMSAVTVRMVSIGNKLILPVPTLQTDEQGAFRIRTAPGKYSVEVFPPPNDSGDVRDKGAPEPVYPTTWFPDSLNKAQATAVEIVAGRETGGIDIHMKRQVPLRISGVVKGLPDGVTNARVMATGTGGNLTAIVGKAGRFTFAGVLPGSYQLTVAGAGGLASRKVSVTVDQTDVTDVELTLQPGEDLSGTLVMPGDRTRATVLLERGANSNFEAETGRSDVGRNGAFTLHNVFPDVYSVDIDPLPGNSYIREVRLDGAVVAGDLDLSNGVKGSQLKIVVSPDGGEISGTVSSADGERLMNSMAYVYLFASGETKHTQDAMIADDGTYTLHGIRPGRYKILAIDLPQLDENRDLKPFLPKAAEIEVKANDKIVRDLKAPDADAQ